MAASSTQPCRARAQCRTQTARSIFDGTARSMTAFWAASAFANRVVAGKVFTSRITSPRRPRGAAPRVSSVERHLVTNGSAERTTATRVAPANIGTVAASSKMSRGSSIESPSNSRHAHDRSASSGTKCPRMSRRSSPARKGSSPTSAITADGGGDQSSGARRISRAERDSATGGASEDAGPGEMQGGPGNGSRAV